MGSLSFYPDSPTEICAKCPFGIMFPETVKHNLKNVNSIDTVSNLTYITNENTLKIWNVDSEPKRMGAYSLEPFRVVKMKASRQKCAIMICEENHLVMLDALTGLKMTEKFITGFKDTPICTGLAVEDDKSIFCTSWDNGYVTQSDLRSPIESCSRWMDSDAILSMDVLQNELWTSGRGGFLRCKDLRFDAGFLFDFHFDQNITALACSPDETFLALGTDSGVAILFEPGINYGFMQKFGDSKIECIGPSACGDWVVFATGKKLVITQSTSPDNFRIFTRISSNPVKLFSISPKDIFLTIIDDSPYAQVCKFIY